MDKIFLVALRHFPGRHLPGRYLAGVSSQANVALGKCRRNVFLPHEQKISNFLNFLKLVKKNPKKIIVAIEDYKPTSLEARNTGLKIIQHDGYS
jgi:hypothetical protein